MITVNEQVSIAAPSDKVYALYLDYTRWHQIFPKTIKSARLIKKSEGKIFIEVDHKTEGHVLNILTLNGTCRIELEEIKPKYTAVFTNTFTPSGSQTLYSIQARILLRGVYKLAAPFIRSLIKKRIRQFVLHPIKQYAEIEAAC